MISMYYLFEQKIRVDKKGNPYTIMGSNDLPASRKGEKPKRSLQHTHALTGKRNKRGQLITASGKLIKKIGTYKPLNITALRKNQTDWEASFPSKLSNTVIKLGPRPIDNINNIDL